MCRSLPAVFLAMFLSLTMQAKERIMQVGLLGEHTVTKLVVMTDKGGYAIKADDKLVYNLLPNDGLRIEVKGGMLHCRTLQRTFTANRKIELVRRSPYSRYRLRAMNTSVEERRYSGDLVIALSKGNMKLMAHVPIEQYVAGVVQSEAGLHKHPEYYKLQAVSSRTYALTNFRKHASEGFQLCDEVHCQVYKGYTEYDFIVKAVNSTRNMVLVDPNIHLIHTTFHSNCGGETANSEDVWTQEVPYLRAVADTFCTTSPHAQWSKEMSRQKWLDYLSSNYGLELNNDKAIDAVLDYDPGCRDLFLANQEPFIPLLQVRKDLQLNSIYFSVKADGEDRVVLEGKGFGHGVGMCQEGAMRMAEAGYPFNDILHFYYTGVHLVDLSSLDFFREEGP